MKMTFFRISTWVLVLVCVMGGLSVREGNAQSTTFAKAPFIIKIDTRGTSQSLAGNPTETQLKPIKWGGLGTFGIDWENDGTIDTTYMFTSFSSFLAKGHSYSTPGIKEIAFYGDGDVKFKINEAWPQLISVEQWGNVTWESCSSMFLSSKYLVSIEETSAPLFSEAGISCGAMFKGCGSLQVNSLEHWDVSNVTEMGLMFAGSSFNGAISSWDVSNVTSFAQMFQSNEVFNQDIGNWDVTSATAGYAINFMFQGASAFNQNLGNWDISNVSAFFGFLSSSGMSTENYDATLAGWASSPSPPSNITLSVSGLTYCTSQDERQTLIDQYNWTISGDELFCNAPPPVAVCKDMEFDIGNSCFPVSPPAALFYDDSDNPNPEQSNLAFSLLEEGILFDVGNYVVNLVVTNENGLSDTCQANLKITADAIPSPFSGWDIGFQGSGGSTYNYDACGTKKFTITTGARTTDGAILDNLATISAATCAYTDKYIVTKLDYVDGYAGLFIRAGNGPSAPVAGIFKGNGILHQILVRGTAYTPVNQSNHIASSSSVTGWVGMSKEGDYLWLYTSGNGSTFYSIGSPVYFPYSCFRVGMAAYRSPHKNNGTALFSKWDYGNYTSNFSEGPSAPTFAIAQQDSALKPRLVPNPATHQVQLQLPQPLSAPALVSVVNQLGQPMMTKEVADSATRVDFLLEGLPAGMYYVNINTGSQIVNLPLVKQ